VRTVDLAVDGLAVFRLTRLLTEDELLAPVREYIWKNHSPEETKIGYFITCPWCTSIWIGGGVVAARTLAPRTWDRAARALSFSAAAGIISQISQRL
jgi:hypothetical protein